MTFSSRVAVLLFLVACIVASQPWLSDSAQAACTPLVAANGVNATCTGATTNQTAPNGYGTGFESSASVTVVQGASVTGAGDGIAFGTGSSVTNAGSILGSGNFGIVINGPGTVTNSGAVNANGTGIGINGPGTITNSGNVSALFKGIDINSSGGTVINSGNVTATGVNSIGIRTLGGMVANSGSVSGSEEGIFILGPGTVTNSGTVTLSSPNGEFGIGIDGPGTVTNSGVVTGIAAGIAIHGTGTITNSGVISGTLAAIQFLGTNNTLTLLPGSTIISAIELNGVGDTVNFRGGNHNLTFNTLTGVTVTGTTPFAVNGNRAAAVDPTPFALSWRTLTDFTGAVSNAVPQFGGGAAASGGAPLAFASSDSSSRIDSAFAALPGVSAYAGDTIAFKAPTVVQADGSAIWARGFAGVREQPADGVLLHAANQFYGGMMGGDWLARPDLRLGAYAGAGHTRTSIDFGSGGDSDLGFAGAYARYLIGATFLQAGLQGGFSQNATNRTINNNLVAGGIEKATASFNGWYVSPEALIGTTLALGRLADAAYTLTPSLKVRYLYGAYGGYTETGTTAPLTVGARNVNVLDERGELKLTRTVTFTPRDALALSALCGLQGSQRTGGDAFSATLLGQAIPFATPGQANVWGGYGGGELDWRTGPVSVFSAAEYLALSDGSHVISGRGGLRVGF